MVPMVDSMPIPVLATMVMSVSPALVGIALALVAGVAWAARGTAEELRRFTTENGEASSIMATTRPTDRIAA